MYGVSYQTHTPFVHRSVYFIRATKMAAGGADSSYKVVLVGDLEVGKTTLYNRFKHGQFVDGGDERQTRQEAEHSKTWQHGGETYSMTLFDTAGMERFEGTLPPTYFRNAFSVIFVYAINNSDSISSIPSWADSVSVQHIGDQGMHIIKALVGNKSDLEDEEREVNAMRAKETAQKSEIEQAMVFEVSAKTGEGVEEMYAAIARAFKTKAKKSAAAASGGSFPQEQPKQKKQCCN